MDTSKLDFWIEQESSVIFHFSNPAFDAINQVLLGDYCIIYLNYIESCDGVMETDQIKRWKIKICIETIKISEEVKLYQQSKINFRT
jgi:hypothetical protein